MSRSDRRVVLRNFEGFLSTYAEPSSYPGHAPETCASCRRRRDDGQEGVAGLLAGSSSSLAPEGYARVHQRLTGIRWGEIHLTALPSSDPD